MRIILILSLLFAITNLHSQVSKVPNKHLPDYESKKMVVSKGMNAWWHISLKTDLMGTRTLGGFVKADQDSMLMLKHIMSVPYLKSLIPQDIKWHDTDALATNPDYPLVLAFENGETKKLTQHKEKSTGLRHSGVLIMGTGGDMYVFYLIDKEILTLFQEKGLLSMEFQILFRNKPINIKYEIEAKNRKRIIGIANKYDKIKL